MKKVFSIIIIISVCFMLAGINIDYSHPVANTQKARCVGYVVIAVDKGVDCNGDTVKLVKEHGYFKFVAKLAKK